MKHRRLRGSWLVMTWVLASLLGFMPAVALDSDSSPGASASPSPHDLGTITLDGVRDADYVQVAVDPSGDLGDPGGWTGTQWTDLTNLYVAADATTLYVYADLPQYSQAGSSGQIGLVLDVDGQPRVGGTVDPWANAITFDYRNMDGAATSDQVLPDYVVRGEIVGMQGSDNGWTELRYWNGSEWTGSGTNWGGISSGQVGTHIAYSDNDGVEFAIPLADVGVSDPASIHLQLFATQGSGTKGAYDTVPSDSQSAGWDDATIQYNLVSVPLAIDTENDLSSPGPGDWNGVAWTDMARLHLWADHASLHLFVPMADYDQTLSEGQIGLAIDAGPGGGSTDAWGNAITFDYDTTWQNLGHTAVVTTGTILPDYLIRGNVFKQNDPGNNGWTELRAWSGSDWNTGGGIDWGDIGNSGQPSLPGSRVAWSSGDGLRLTIPFSQIGVSAGDTVNLQFFGTQGGASKGAYDTVPSDDQSSGWDDATTQLVLSSYTIPDIELPGASQDNNIWWDGLHHDSRDSLYRSPLGAVPAGTPVTIRFRAYANDLTGVTMRVWDDRVDAQSNLAMQLVASDGVYDYWAYSLPAQAQTTVLWYRFIPQDGTAVAYYEDDLRDESGVYRGYEEGGPGKAYVSSPDFSFQLTVYDPAFQTPDWMREAVVYQIFTDRFRDGNPANNVISGTHFFYGDPDAGITYSPWNSEANNPRDPSSLFYNRWNEDFYGGDLPGVTSKLDYLQSLGVTTLYLNPIFWSPSTHKYDTTSFEKVDPHFGGNAALAELVAAAQSRGLYVILDGVFNHTSSDSIYFDRYSRYPTTGAFESQSSPYYDWYTFVNWPDDYVSWWGYDSLPVLLSENTAVRDYFYSGTEPIGTRWVVSGTNGWRLDVGGDIDPGVTREPGNDYWEGFREAVKGTDPEAIVIGEEWGDATPWLLGDEWDAVMNYRFRSALLSFLRDRPYQDNDNNPGSSGGVLDPITPSQLDAWLHSIREDYPDEAWWSMMNLLGSHDTSRLRFVLSKSQKADDPIHLPYNPATDFSPAEVDVYQKFLALLQFTTPGAPTIYYGDEVGVEGPDYWANNKWEDDPYNRVPFPWDDTPGYYSQRPGIVDHYSLLGQTRAAHPALRTGDFRTILTDDQDMVYAFGRKLISNPSADAAVVILNRDTAAHEVTVPVAGYLGAGAVFTDVLDGGTSYTVVSGQIVVPDVPPMGGALLVLDSGDVTPPNAPLNLTATEGDGQVELGWNAVGDAVVYDVYRSYATGGGYTRIMAGTAGTSYTDADVTNGTWYYYVVTAHDAAGNESDPSDEAAALPHVGIGWAGNLEPTSIAHTIGLTPTEPIQAEAWIEGVTSLPGQGEGLVAELGYGISGTVSSTWETWTPMQYAGDLGNNDQYSAVLVPEQVGTLQYLARFSTTGGRDWTYAYTTAGKPGTLIVSASPDTAPPDTPLNLNVVDWAADRVVLAWDPLIGDPSLYAYDLFRSEVSGTVGILIARVLAPATMYTDTEVTSGHAYYYTVQALDSSFNRSGYSNQVEAIPQAKMVSVIFQAVVPDYTPDDATAYVVGDVVPLCGWCNPQTVAMDRTGDITWTKAISLPNGQAIQYKYTRGTWDVNEWWGPIVSVSNRHATVDYGSHGSQLLADVVHYWRDPLVITHQPLDGAVDLDPSLVISVTVSRYLDPATINAENLVLSSGMSTPTLDIDFDYHAEMTATTILLSPTVALDEGAVYRMTLKTGLRGAQDDNEGIALQREYTWTFHILGYKVYLPLVFRDNSSAR